MQLPYSLDVLANAHHADLLHEAATERLASQATRRPPLVRRRLAEVLYTFAARLDPCAVPASLIPRRIRETVSPVMGETVSRSVVAWWRLVERERRHHGVRQRRDAIAAPWPGGGRRSRGCVGPRDGEACAVAGNCRGDGQGLPAGADQADRFCAGLCQVDGVARLRGGGIAEGDRPEVVQGQDAARTGGASSTHSADERDDV